MVRLPHSLQSRLRFLGQPRLGVSLGNFVEKPSALAGIDAFENFDRPDASEDFHREVGLLQLSKKVFNAASDFKRRLRREQVLQSRGSLSFEFFQAVRGTLTNIKSVTIQVANQAGEFFLGHGSGWPQSFTKTWKGTFRVIG